MDNFRDWFKQEYHTLPLSENRYNDLLEKRNAAKAIYEELDRKLEDAFWVRRLYDAAFKAWNSKSE